MEIKFLGYKLIQLLCKFYVFPEWSQLSSKILEHKISAEETIQPNWWRTGQYSRWHLFPAIEFNFHSHGWNLSSKTLTEQKLSPWQQQCVRINPENPSPDHDIPKYIFLTLGHFKFMIEEWMLFQLRKYQWGILEFSFWTKFYILRQYRDPAKATGAQEEWCRQGWIKEKVQKYQQIWPLNFLAYAEKRMPKSLSLIWRQ